MASSPSSSPFFSPTTAPSYASTAVFSPTPCGCGAPPYAPCSLSPAATYPPNPFPGGYYTPAFPCAGTYSNQPPADAYTPANGFSPNWPTWPPPSPDPTPSTSPATFSSFPTSTFRAPTTTPNPFEATTPAPVSFLAPGYGPYVFPSEIPTQISPDWSLAAPTPIHGDLHHHHHRSPPTHGHLPVQAALQPSAVPTTPSRESLPAQSRQTPDSRPPQSKTSTPRRPLSSPPLPRREASTLQRELLNIEARLDQQQARERIAIETIQDGLVKLTSMASQVTVAMGMQTTKVLATEPSPTLAFASTSPTTTALRSSDMGATASSTVNSLGASFAFPTPTSGSTVLAAPAYVAPQMVGEMPAPLSEYENYCCGTSNTIQSSCVHDRSINVSSQCIEEMPQTYGFHNLNVQSVIRADGMEHNYFTLPADYPLKRVVPEPVFAVDDDGSDGGSNESVHVFSTTPEQQSYEEERQSSEQLLKCVDKAPETEQTSDCLSISDVFDYALEQQQQDGETSVKEHQHLRAPQLNVLVVQEKRKKWDPTASVHFTSSKTQHPDQALQLETHGTMLACSSVCSECKCWIENNIYVCKISENGMAAYTPWDPGILNVKDMMLDKYTVNQQVQFGQRTTDLLFLSLTGCIQCIAINDINSLLHDTSFILQRAAHFSQGFKCSSAFGLGWTKVNPSVQSVPVVPCFKSTSAAKRSLLLSSGGNNRPSQSILNLFLQSLCATTAVQVTDCNGINPVLHASVLVMQRDAHLSQGNCMCSLYFNSGLKTEYCPEFSMNMSTRLQWDPGVRVSLGWLDMLKAWSETDKPLSCTSAPDLAAWPNHSAVCIWDLRIATSSYLYSWLEMIVVKTFTRLPSPVPMLKYLQCPLPMNETYCSEDKFLHQQGVQKNYNANNLLSAHNYLQMWTMDIFFITFLTP